MSSEPQPRGPAWPSMLLIQVCCHAINVSLCDSQARSLQDFTYTTLWELAKSGEDLADVLGGSGGSEESRDSDEGLHVDC